MTAVAWIGIEQAAPQPGQSAASGGVTGTAAPSHPTKSQRQRLRRHERRVIGPFDLGSTVFQRHAREVIVGSAVFIVPAVVLNVIVSNLVFSRFSSFDDIAISVPEFIGGVDAATGVETLLAFAAIVINSLMVALVGGYLTSLVVRRSLGLDVTIRAVLGSMTRRIPALTVAWFLGHSWMFLGSWALVKLSAADLAPLAMLIVPLVGWVVCVTLVVSPVIVAERLGPVGGLRRSLQLVRRRSGTAFTFVLLCVLIGGGLRVLIGALPQLIEATGFLTFGRFGGLAEGVASQMSQLVIVPLVGVATAQCYLQMRMDLEGMDLLVEADVVFPR
jgi:hypothetical protein